MRWLLLLVLLFASCRAPAPVHESDVVPACEGVTVWATLAGDVVQLTFAEVEENRARVLRFEGGALRLDLSGAVTGGDPRLEEVLPGQWCARGGLDGAECLVDWWAARSCITITTEER